MKIKTYFLALLAIAGIVSFQSCDDENYDVTGNPDNLIYFPPSKSRPDNMPNAVETFTVIATPVGYLGDEVYAKFGVRATRPMSGAATVTAVIDNSLVETYNAKYGTEYKICPIAVLQKAAVTIADGAYSSSDSIEVVIPEEKYAELTEKGEYLIPVHLESATHGKVTAIENVAFVIMTLKEKYIKEGAGTDDIKGSIVNDRSAWTAAATDASVDATTLAKIFDSDDNTGAVFSNEENPTVTIDLHAIKKVGALYFRNAPASDYRGYFYNFNSIGMQLSTDGNTWTDVDTAAPVVKNNIDQYIVFYGTVSCRYIKLSLQWRYGHIGSSYRRFNEINIYAE